MKRPLLLALFLSLLLHLALLSSGMLPELSPLKDQPLEPIKMRLSTMELGQAPQAHKPAPPPAGGMQIKALPTPKRQDPQAAAHKEASGTLQQTAPSTDREQTNEAASEETESSAPQAANVPRDGYLSARTRHKRFPVQAHLRYQLYYYGTVMAGTTSIDWQREGNHYRLESIVNPVIGPKLRYQSIGTISRAGIRPDSYNAWRNDTPREHARFDWDQKQLDYGDNEDNSVALQSGAQDIFSLIYQLALKGAEHPPVQITTGKKVYQYPLAPSGETDFDTGYGKIRALVFRAEGDGDRTEFWLAPDFANQPIRIIRTDAKMKLDMRVIDITIDNNSEWQQPKQLPRKHEK